MNIADLTAPARVLPGADVDPSARIGSGSTVWQLSQVREGSVLGRHCVIGRGAYVGAGVVLGENCKLQNYALIYEPALLEDGVFVGPGAVFTNDQYPRAITPEGSLKSSRDWKAVGVTARRGASVGARAVCVAPVTLGAWCLVAAGAVVIRDVPAYGLVAGNPARRLGWVGPAGVPLEQVAPAVWRCPRTRHVFHEGDEALVPDTDLS